MTARLCRFESCRSPHARSQSRGMKLTASTTTPTTTPCLTRGRRPRVIAFSARGPGSSPGILHHHSRAGTIGLPPAKRSQPHHLAREIASRGCSSVGRAQRLTTTLPDLGRRLRVTGRKFESCHPHQTGRRSLVIATSRGRATGAVQPEFRDPGAAIAHTIAVSPGRNHLPI